MVEFVASLLAAWLCVSLSEARLRRLGVNGGVAPWLGYVLALILGGLGRYLGISQRTQLIFGLCAGGWAFWLGLRWHLQQWSKRRRSKRPSSEPTSSR